MELIVSDQGKFAIESVLGVVSILLALLTFIQKHRIKALKDQTNRLEKGIHKITSKVDPESDRMLVIEADKSVQITGINSLGPLHHCREEIIQFLNERKGSLQILLLDPNCEAFAARAQKEGDLSQRLLSEWRAALSILKDIESRTRRKIDLRLRSDMPDRSLFIVDALPKPAYTTRMLINYYPGENGTRGYSGAQYMAEFELERDRDSLFKNIDYYSMRWERAVPTSIDGALELGNKLQLKSLSSRRS
jgi:hypothetical protein